MPTFRHIYAGEIFGRLTVVKTRERGETLIQCRCSCGNFKSVEFRLLGDKTNSCGCLYSGRNNHRWNGGKSSHYLYHTYHDMISRCSRSTHHAYSRYGGRGIYVCKEWIADFWTFVSDMGDRPEGTSLDRIDNDGPYSADNCRWADTSTQMKNRRQPNRSRDSKTGRFVRTND